MGEWMEGGREIAAGQFDELTYADGRLHWERSRVGEDESESECESMRVRWPRRETEKRIETTVMEPTEE